MPLPNSLSRRRFLELLGLGVPVAAALAACSSSGPSQAGAGGGGAKSGGGGSATYWFLSGQPQQKIREDAVKAFNASSKTGQISYTEFQNDAYKTKIKTAIGAGKAPTIIWGWGGGGLRSYVQDNKVEDLTDWFGQNADVKNRLFASSFGAATVDNKIYAMPCETVQPIILFWNKKVFDDAGAEPPKSWDDILNLIPKFKAKNVAPISLGGQSLWTNMMWLEFLFDRIGGPDVFGAVFNGEKNAWSNPDSIKALTEMQKLIKAGGFINGFQSITADSNADQALLYTGKAAMMLHGSWTYASMKADGGDFVTGGHLGWMNFPPVRRRQGRSVRHGRQPRPVPLDLVGRLRGREEHRQGLLQERCAHQRRGQGVDRHRRRPDRQERVEPAGAVRRRRLPEVRLRRLEQREGLRAVVGPGDEPDRRDYAARHDRQAVRPVDHAAAVRRHHERDHRQMTAVARPRERTAPASAAPPRGRRQRSLTLAGAAGVRDLLSVRARPADRRGAAQLHQLGRAGHHPRQRADQLEGGTEQPRARPLAMGDVPDHGVVVGVPDADEHSDRRLHRRTAALSRVLSVFYFIPLLLSAAAIAITWKALLDPNFGLGPGLHWNLLTQNWLGNPKLAVGVVIFIVSWQFIPFHSLIYQGAVRQIPTSMYEAAKLDGAGRVRQFFSITLPQLKYTIITSSTLMVVGSLTFFDLIFVLTYGGPADATDVLALNMYKQGFVGNQMGQASAIAVILVFVGLAIALLLRRLGGRDATASQMEGA